MQGFLPDVPHFCTYFHPCQYGSSRRNLLCSCTMSLRLESLCDNQRAHEPWGQTADGWATSEEIAHPWELCRAIATKFAFGLTGEWQ